jgi:hypothetical protein
MSLRLEKVWKALTKLNSAENYLKVVPKFPVRRLAVTLVAFLQVLFRQQRPEVRLLVRTQRSRIRQELRLDLKSVLLKYFQPTPEQ